MKTLNARLFSHSPTCLKWAKERLKRCQSLIISMFHLFNGMFQMNRIRGSAVKNSSFNAWNSCLKRRKSSLSTKVHKSWKNSSTLVSSKNILHTTVFWMYLDHPAWDEWKRLTMYCASWMPNLSRRFLNTRGQYSLNLKWLGMLSLKKTRNRFISTQLFLYKSHFPEGSEKVSQFEPLALTLYSTVVCLSNPLLLISKIFTGTRIFVKRITVY